MWTLLTLSLSRCDRSRSIYRLKGALLTEFHYSGGEKVLKQYFHVASRLCARLGVAFQSILTVLDLFSTVFT